MSKPSLLDKAIADLEAQRAPLVAKAEALSQAIAALERAKVAKAVEKRVRKKKPEVTV